MVATVDEGVDLIEQDRLGPPPDGSRIFYSTTLEDDRSTLVLHEAAATEFYAHQGGHLSFSGTRINREGRVFPLKFVFYFGADGGIATHSLKQTEIEWEAFVVPHQVWESLKQEALRVRELFTARSSQRQIWARILSRVAGCASDPRLRSVVA